MDRGAYGLGTVLSGFQAVLRLYGMGRTLAPRHVCKRTRDEDGNPMYSTLGSRCALALAVGTATLGAVSTRPANAQDTLEVGEPPHVHAVLYLTSSRTEARQAVGIDGLAIELATGSVRPALHLQRWRYRGECREVGCDRTTATNLRGELAYTFGGPDSPAPFVAVGGGWFNADEGSRFVVDASAGYDIPLLDRLGLRVMLSYYLRTPDPPSVLVIGGGVQISSHHHRE